MRSFKIRKIILSSGGLKTLPLAMLLASAAGHAQDAASMFSYSGFGTAGVVHSSSKNGDFVSSLYQTSGAGASHDWDFGTDSKLGVQLNAKFTDQLSAVVQVVSMPRPNNTYGPRFEWANLQYAITPDWKVRVGRTALPTFMVSDTRLVGYANTWMRPPVEMYSAIPMTNLDGIDTSYKLRFGEVTNTLQLYAGKSNIETVTSFRTVVSSTIRKARGVANTIEYGALTARVGYLQSDVTINLAPGFGLYTPQKEYNIGAAYDPGNWFIQGEYTNSKLPGFTPVQKSYYVTGGYRIGNFTPYAIYANVTPGKPAAIISYDQNTTSLGVRWDAMKNIAVKVQFDRVQLGTGATGYFGNVKPGLAGSNVNLLGLSVDFVF